MQHISRTTAYTRMLVRISVILLAFVLGHDAAMAVHPYEQQHTDLHHEIVAEQCGIDEGHIQSPGQLPTAHIEADACSSSASQYILDERSQIPPTASVSKLRALLQVYLN